MKHSKSYLAHQKKRQRHWDSIAKEMDTWHGWNSYYNLRLQHIYKFLIPPKMKVLEIGCGAGNLLAALQPEFGVGVDVSKEMIKSARKKHPNLTFIHTDIHEFESQKRFDYIILSDLINELWDVQEVFNIINSLTHSGTRIIINYFSRLWEWPLAVARALGVAKPNLVENWLANEDVKNLLYLANMNVIRSWEEILCPLPIPIIAPLCNKFLVRFWPWRFLAMTTFTLARPFQTKPVEKRKPSVSIIIPARNEAGNIKAIFERTPEMGKQTELVFVEGHSQDNTLQHVKNQIANHPQKTAVILNQEGKGKGDAVRLGFSKAKGDILMIMDADLTVAPEDLPRFYNALVSNKGEFINGVRLIYPMEKHAMRFLNILGNKAFSFLFTFLLGQPIKDTLCGTKVLWKKDYQRIAANRAYFGDFDPFGDYDLIFGATKLNLKIIDMPIRYRERTYGETNIQRWKHGWLLLRMVVFAARRLKFI